VSGRFRIDLSVGSFVLENEGDYALWGRGSTILAGREGYGRDHRALAVSLRELNRPAST
jgi:hypothetical protein